MMHYIPKPESPPQPGTQENRDRFERALGNSREEIDAAREQQMLDAIDGYMDELPQNSVFFPI